MAALFPSWTNTLARVGGFLLLATPAVAVGALLLYPRTPFSTHQADPLEQPVQFDHRHHVADEAIDCRYCHNTVEVSATAGIPATSVCMNCHSQIWNKSPLLDLVRESYFADRPIPWNRVHDLPDFVYFNHAIHVNKGVGCVTCHGRVDHMPAVEQVAPLTMGWCLDCHRDPAPNLRPRDKVTDLAWMPEGDARAQGMALAREYQVHTRTSCSTCHR